MVHGFVPCLFEKTGSVMVHRLHNQLHGGANHHEDEKMNQD
jgi:hypothetical protein